jgi:hypothetical protein
LSVELLQQAIASLFKRKSKSEMSRRELEQLSSLELRWFEPADARKLVELAIKMGVLEETEGGLKPVFDIDSIDVPFSFKPEKKLLNSLEHDQESLFMQLVNHISIKTNLDSKEIVAEINDRQSTLGDLVTLETIAILYGEEKEIDMSIFIPMVKSKLLSN